MHRTLPLRIGAVVLGTASLALCAVAATVPVESQALPRSTAIPVRFERSVDAKNAKTGDEVTAKTIQVIVLPDGRKIAKGTVLAGHVTAAQAFHFDATPYAHQQPSVLSIHFDTLQAAGAAVPVNLSVRAIANVNDSKDATYAHSADDTDHVGTVTLIGGTSFSPLEKMIQSGDGDAIGYNRRSGVFARLVASGSPQAGAALHCDGTDTEQSVAIFSPDACGAYGFGGDYLAGSGQDGSGTFTLSVRGHSVKLYAGSTALLQAN